MFINFIHISRPHQWIKNFLIFSPLIAAHQFKLSYFLNVIPLFISFCLLASAVYCYNDIKDLLNDQNHPEKKKRPLAANKVTKKQVIFYIFFLLSVSFLIAFYFYKLDVLCVLIFYLLLNLLYSNYLKKIFLIDVLTLSFFYILRIFVGSIVDNIELSNYFVLFTFSSFIALASIKRLAENIKNYNSNSIYKNFSNLLFFIALLGIFLSFIIFIFYTYSEYSILYYKNIYYLFVAEIVIFLWFLRILYLTKKGKIFYDPVKYVIHDKITWVVVFFVFIIFISNSNRI
ncbi:UbiA family prenyltransferase [Candidatus Pelagibacter sp.]|nr:UbiA family prenyltransferase [Candidatus Pelagibacter sp.]